jgi:hypothetical protein
MSQPIAYVVTIYELAFSGVPGAPCEWAVVTGKRALERAIECAEREFPQRASIQRVTVTQRGGKRNGNTLWYRENPNAYMTEGHPYCAGIRALGGGKFEVTRGVSRDSRRTYPTPPVLEISIETVESAPGLLAGL